MLLLFLLLLLLLFHAHCISSFQRDSALWRRSANVSAWSSSNGSGSGEWKEAFNWLSSSARRLEEEKGSAAAEQNGFYIITLNDSRLYSSSCMIQATVDAKRKEIELLKLQTALVLVGDGVHREILDHFAPWIVRDAIDALHWSHAAPETTFWYITRTRTQWRCS